MPLLINADDLLLPLDMHHEEIESYLDLQTGAVIPAMWNEFGPGDPEYAEMQTISDDPARFRVIEPVPSRSGWLWMQEFAEEVADSRVRERLLDAIAGSGAFGRFKRVLASHPDLRDAWFRHQNQRLLRLRARLARRGGHRGRAHAAALARAAWMSATGNRRGDHPLISSRAVFPQ